MNSNNIFISEMMEFFLVKIPKTKSPRKSRAFFKIYFI